jgi:hypothetical protein
MKKIITPLFLILFLACTNNNDDIKTPTSQNPDNKPEYSLPTCNDFVVFSGDSFLLLLRTLGYDTNGDTKISCSEANAIINLNLGNDQRVQNLVGIESLKNLETITGTLNLNGGTVNLFNNTKLKEINFNVSPTTGTTSMISKLVLPNGNSLLKLDASSTSIRTVENITNQSSLKIIKIMSGLVGELDLSNCPSLEEIKIPYNNNIDGVKLTTHNKLKILYIPSSQSKLINLLGLPNLEELHIGSNGIDNLNLSNNTKLKILSATKNRLPNINLKNNPLLEELYLGSNLLGVIDLSLNVNLKTVYVNDNYLTYLNLKNGNNSNLKLMDATNNNLNCIQVDQIVSHMYWKKDNQANYSVNCN